jgi:hypothetical protein
MSLSKIKIGQNIVIKEDLEIKGFFDEEDKTQIKKGDSGFVDSNGFLHYETGEGSGKIQKINDIHLDGYDTENIARLIFERLKYRFNLGEYMEENEYEKKEFIEEIDDILSEIF